MRRRTGVIIKIEVDETTEVLSRRDEHAWLAIVQKVAWVRWVKLDWNRRDCPLGRERHEDQQTANTRLYTRGCVERGVRVMKRKTLVCESSKGKRTSRSSSRHKLPTCTRLSDEPFSFGPLFIASLPSRHFLYTHITNNITHIDDQAASQSGHSYLRW